MVSQANVLLRLSCFCQGFISERRTRKETEPFDFPFSMRFKRRVHWCKLVVAAVVSFFVHSELIPFTSCPSPFLQASRHLPPAGSRHQTGTAVEKENACGAHKTWTRIYISCSTCISCSTSHRNNRCCSNISSFATLKSQKTVVEFETYTRK